MKAMKDVFFILFILLILYTLVFCHRCWTPLAHSASPSGCLWMIVLFISMARSQESKTESSFLGLHQACGACFLLEGKLANIMQHFYCKAEL